MLEVSLDLGAGKVPPAVLRHQAEDALPSLVVRGMNHPAKDPPVGLRAEDRRAENAVEQPVGARVIEQNEIARLARASRTEMRLEAALPIRMTQ